MVGKRVEIDQFGSLGQYSRLKLDGVDVTCGTTAVSFRVEVGEPTTVAIEVFAKKINGVFDDACVTLVVTDPDTGETRRFTNVHLEQRNEEEKRTETETEASKGELSP